MSTMSLMERRGWLAACAGAFALGVCVDVLVRTVSRRVVEASSSAEAEPVTAAAAAAHDEEDDTSSEEYSSSVDDEPWVSDPSEALGVVGRATEGALLTTQLYLGSRLGLYEALVRRRNAWTTAIELSLEMRLNLRYLREWLAQQAAMGVLCLKPGQGDSHLQYRIKSGFAAVLAEPESEHYLPMYEAMPALMAQARDAIPQAFATGLGVAYDDADISEALDKAHARYIKVTAASLLGETGADALLTRPGARVADLGCGGGNLLQELSARYPTASVEGYEVSDVALKIARRNTRFLPNTTVKDARLDPLGSNPQGAIDVVTTLDVLHDAADPDDLCRQVKHALKPDGFWLLGDMLALDTTRDNITQNPNAAELFAFSTCLCLACGTASPGGRGLGTLGFSVPVATTMLQRAGFSRIDVVREGAGIRWFRVAH